jgi:hypothetical protein
MHLPNSSSNSKSRCCNQIRNGFQIGTQPRRCSKSRSKRTLRSVVLPQHGTRQLQLSKPTAIGERLCRAQDAHQAGAVDD